MITCLAKRVAPIADCPQNVHIKNWLQVIAQHRHKKTFSAIVSCKNQTSTEADKKLNRARRFGEQEMLKYREYIVDEQVLFFSAFSTFRCIPTGDFAFSRFSSLAISFFALIFALPSKLVRLVRLLNIMFM